MAEGENPKHSAGDSHRLSDLRIVLLGYRYSGKSSAGNTILNREEFELKTTAQCVKRQREVAERNITVVEAPGWWSNIPVEESTELLKQEIVLSVSLCPPGPHAVLLIIRVDSGFKEKERNVLEGHMKLLLESVWSHTIVLFTCGDYLGDTLIEQHIESEGKDLQWLVEKCGNRYHLLNNKNKRDDSQVTELLEKIEVMVAANSGRHFEIDRKILQEVEEKRRAEEERGKERMMKVQKQREEMKSQISDSHRLSDLRIVLLGYIGAGKSSAGNTILNREEFELKTTAQCVKRQREVAERNITVVEAPGWWRDVSVERSTELLKQEIVLSVSLCPPGPHAVLLIIRVDTVFKEKERNVLEGHMKLLLKSVWSHTIVLFTCGDYLGDTLIEQYIESEGKDLQWLVEKCGNRYHVLNNMNRSDDSQVTELLEKIEEMVAANSGRFFDLMKIRSKGIKRRLSSESEEKKKRRRLNKRSGFRFGRMTYGTSRDLHLADSAVLEDSSADLDIFSHIVESSRVTSDSRREASVDSHAALRIRTEQVLQLCSADLEEDDFFHSFTPICPPAFIQINTPDSRGEASVDSHAALRIRTEQVLQLCSADLEEDDFFHSFTPISPPALIQINTLTDSVSQMDDLIAIANAVTYLGYSPLLEETVVNPCEQPSTVVFIPEVMRSEIKSNDFYRFLCPHAGQFQCRVTSLMFEMEDKGEVLYRIDFWDDRLLDGLGQMQPAGPLYNIDCFEGSISRLHLPHCEIQYGENQGELAVAHLTGDNIEVISPLKVTHTHVVISIQGLSFFGVLKRMITSASPITGQVQNRHVDFRNINTSSKCQLIPGKKYRPSCNPYIFQPTIEIFDCDYGPNYHPTFEVFLNPDTEDVTVGLLKENGEVVWEPRLVILAGAEFVDENRETLIQKVSSVMEIADCIQSKDMITDEQYSNIQTGKTSQEQMRILYKAVASGGTTVKEEFYEILKKKQPFLIDELEAGPSKA